MQAIFLIGKHFLIETDHNLLVPLLGVKHLDTLPPLVLRFRLRPDRFDYPLLLYGVENWILCEASLYKLESVQGELANSILRLPRSFSNTAAKIALGWPSMQYYQEAEVPLSSHNNKG